MSTPEEQQLRQLLFEEWRRIESEKAAMARRVHDGTSQYLTVLTMELALMQQRFESNPDEAAKLTFLLELLKDINESVRGMTADLFPRILQEFGIAAAIASECRQYGKKTGRPIRLTGEEKKVTVSNEAAIQVFRLFQELMNLLLTVTEGELQVEFSAPKENCRFGFQISGKTGAGMLSKIPNSKLVAIKERAQAAGGKLSQKEQNAAVLFIFELA